MRIWGKTWKLYWKIFISNLPIFYHVSIISLIYLWVKQPRWRMPLVAEMESSLRTLVPQSPHFSGSFPFYTVLALGLDMEQMLLFLAGQFFFLPSSILSPLKLMLWELLLPFLVALIYWPPGHSPPLSNCSCLILGDFKIHVDASSF